MPSFRIEMRAQAFDEASARQYDKEAFAEAGERVMQELIALQGTDPFVGTELDSAILEVWVTLDAPDEFEALTRGVGLIRSAIHAAGGETPGWERTFKNLRPIAQEVQAV